VTMTKPGAQTRFTKFLWRIAGVTIPVILIMSYMHEKQETIPVLAGVYLANLSGFMHGTIAGETKL
jgi:hypothetical protein